MAATKIQGTREIWPTRLKEARTAAGLSQRELGIAAGIDPGVASTRINRYEVGVHKADFQIAVQLAKVLRVPAAFLYCEDNEVAALLVALHRAPSTLRRRLIREMIQQTQG